MPLRYRALGPVAGDEELLSQAVYRDGRVSAPSMPPDSLAKWRRAHARTPWAQTHLRDVALLSDDTLQASGTIIDLSAMLDGQVVPICGLTNLAAHAGDDGRGTQRLTEAALTEAEASGASALMLLGPEPPIWATDLGFIDVTPATLSLRVLAGRRPGAPMLSIRAGEQSDLPQIAEMADSMPPVRFRLRREMPFIAHSLSASRLKAGLKPEGAERVEFFVTEEGTRAAAYVVLRVDNSGWRLEQCGDRDPSGARVGAILQALVARDPSANAPSIHGWLPGGWMPPQLEATPAPTAQCRVLLRLLRKPADGPALASRDVIMWMADLFQAS